MNRKRIFFIFLCFCFQYTQAQLIENCKIFEEEAKQYQNRLNQKSIKETSQYDVSSYHLKLSLNPAFNYVQGSVIIQLRTTIESTQSIFLDLSDALEVDSVLHNKQLMPYKRKGNNAIEILLLDTIPIDTNIRLEVFYQGVPSAGYRSFIQSSYKGDSILWTLSQPYGAQDWWPCKNSLNDKADSVVIEVKVPKAYKVASIGLLKSIDSTTANHHTYYWQTNYPTAPYLVAIAIGKYNFYEEKIKLKDDSLLMQHFLYQDQTLNSSNNAISGFLTLFDSLFGPYPFIKEKYGHASFTAPGGMEHQTMSFMGSYGGELVAHELAHQWFGDKVTCGSWQDLWLNEGFATYLAALTYEFNVVHDKSYWPIVKKNLHAASFNFPNGSVFKEDTTNVANLFNATVYQKGAIILHMLRWQIGDSAFFAGVRNYINDSLLAYSFARTADLKTHLEKSSGHNLSEFFKDWYYGKGFPTYTTSWTQNLNTIDLKIEQSSSDPSVFFFNVPIPYQLYSNNWDTTIVLNPQFSGQRFSLEINRTIDSISFDKEDWILAKHDVLSNLSKKNPKNEQILIYPNPSHGLFTINGLELTNKVNLTVFSSNGTSYSIPIRNNQLDLRTLPKGIYYFKIEIENNIIIKKLITY